MHARTIDVTPYRREHRAPDGATGSARGIDEPLIYALCVGVGAIPLVGAICAGDVLGAEASLGGGLVTVGALGLVRELGHRARGPRRPRTGARR